MLQVDDVTHHLPATTVVVTFKRIRRLTRVCERQVNYNTVTGGVVLPLHGTHVFCGGPEVGLGLLENDYTPVLCKTLLHTRTAGRVSVGLCPIEQGALFDGATNAHH